MKWGKELNLIKKKSEWNKINNIISYIIRL
jgi:hypothetical protein